jgi:ribonuclease HII
MQLPTLKFERKLWRKGVQFVAGIDEAGRGALAGPVVAAAVIMKPGKIPAALRGIRDSKTVSEDERERLYEAIVASDTFDWSAAAVANEAIDCMNIYNASIAAMQHALDRLSTVPERVLIDGYFPAGRLGRMGANATCIIKGDAKVFSIAAASIIAKVTRDRMMRVFHNKYRKYGFAAHKGYGTALHYAALRKHGPCVLHRRSFCLQKPDLAACI